jgi:hypothetical protein
MTYSEFREPDVADLEEFAKMASILNVADRRKP